MNTVTVKKLLDGSKNLMILVYLKSDGISGELVNQTLIDPVADLGLQSNARLLIQRIEYNFSGFDAVVEFDAGGVTPNFKWVLTEGANCPIDFEKWGGIKDDSGLDGTGKFQITTTGFTASTDQGSIVIFIRKP